MVSVETRTLRPDERQRLLDEVDQGLPRGEIGCMATLAGAAVAVALGIVWLWFPFRFVRSADPRASRWTRWVTTSR